ncbi:hypothetical protein AK830_g5413 [Neonectria ditissima]|uniref:protein S-acyltransferase n=1 Tax=Neonectria ditissima TaxID=78410 RepID=A0A0P7BL54_9HYPO|nr:hypothetical protein AK830_g5413 [Neonectria ditissima]
MAEYVGAIVGLVAAGAHVGHRLYQALKSFKHAQDEFLALSNEITDFRLLLNAVEMALRNDTIPDEAITEIDLAGLLQQSHTTFNEVSTLLNEIQHVGTTGAKVKRRRWLINARKASALQVKIKNHKLLLSSLSQAHTSHMTAKIAISVNQVSASNDALMRGQAALQAESTALCRTMREIRQDISPELVECLQHVSESVQQLVDRNGHDDPGSKRMGNHLQENVRTRIEAEQAVTPEHVMRATLTITCETKLVCYPNCLCRCHLPSFVHLYTSRYLGRLLAGYSSLPGCLSWLRPCNEQSCRRNADPRRFQLHYVFPGWFLNYVARLHVTAQLAFLPLYVCLTTSVTRQEPAAIFDAIKAKNVHLTKKLLLDGDASICDVSSYGWGHMHYASFYCWGTRDCDMSMISILLDAGVDVDYEDRQGYRPIEIIVDDILMNKSIAGDPVRGISSQALADVRVVFRLSAEDMDDSYRDCKGLSHLHEVLLGIDKRHCSLGDCLLQGEITQDSINVADRRGRTPVTWAAEFGCADALRLFLEAGADPSQSGPAVCGFQPLLTLAISSPAAQRGDEQALETIRLLLQADADVNAKDGSGRAVIHMAAAKKNIEVLRIMDRYGGNKVDWRALTPKGESVVDIARLVGASSDFVALTKELWSARDEEEDLFWDATEYSLT